ncbi:MAG: deoxyribose-phosphate aldolase [Gemmatimonadota bacterium]|jgi:deoxyribose-phosphate aldolase|nr:deoxyribose-phosphate aldolase [Gemmatimonadota bacterium]
MGSFERSSVDSGHLGGAIEATRLNYGLTDTVVRDLVRQAAGQGVRAVCIPPAFVASAVAEVAACGASVEVVTVACFPMGDASPVARRAQVTEAVEDGADHIDLVLPGALIADRCWTELIRHIREVRLWMDEAAGSRSVALKTILESAAWDEDRLRCAAMAAVEGGARWLKTSTGFHPAGGATPEAVALLRGLAPEGVGVKASGGIRTREQAIRMLEAGADRIGTSSEMAILGPVSGSTGPAGL